MPHGEPKYHANFIGYGDLSRTAWQINKVSQDFSLFHGVFTFNIPRVMWKTFENGSEIYDDASLTKISTVNSKLRVESGTSGEAYVESRRYPRYQPNRGHLDSNSIFLPDKNADGIRNIGYFTSQHGAMFRLEDGVLYGIIRTYINSTIIETVYLIDGEDYVKNDGTFEIDRVNGVLTHRHLPIDGVDFEKGNIYDIQMQWRGVGDIVFFLGNPREAVSIEVHRIRNLNRRTELTINNPANPICFHAESKGTNVQIEIGCADISTEGGNVEPRQYQTIVSDEISVGNVEKDIIAFRIPETVFGGMINTRDIVLSRISAYIEGSNGFINIYSFRDPSLINAIWTDRSANDPFQQVAQNGDITSTTKANMQLLIRRRIQSNVNVEIENPDPNNSTFYVSNGDYVLVTLEAKGGTNPSGVTIEFGEEI